MVDYRPSTSAGGQMFFQESVPERVQVFASDSVTAVRIFHETELFVQTDKFIEQALGSLKMDIVVAGAVDDEQFALETIRKIDRGTVMVTGGILIRQTHIAFLID